MALEYTLYLENAVAPEMALESLVASAAMQWADADHAV